MFDRRDITGFGLAVLGHAGLIAAIFYLIPHEAPPPPPPPEGIQVTLTDEIGLTSAAPDPSTEPPAQAAQGEDVPKEAEPAPAEPEPEVKPDAVPTKVPPKPDPRDRRRPDAPTRPNPNSGIPDYSRNPPGPAKEKTDGEGDKPQAAATGEQKSNYLSAIKRQVQPCADRQVIPAPEARQIVAIVQLSLRRDGSLESVRITSHEGVTDENRRYVPRVDDAVEAIFAGCTPIRGLPVEIYDVPGGWRSVKFRYRLNS